MLWIIAIIVPVLATLGGPWLAGHLAVGSETVLEDHTRLLIHFFLAASPLITLAVFSALDRVERPALRRAALVTGAATLAIWAWYHAGAIGVAPLTAGIVLMLSPILCGMLALALYAAGARAR